MRTLQLTAALSLALAACAPAVRVPHTVAIYKPAAGQPAPARIRFAKSLKVSVDGTDGSVYSQEDKEKYSYNEILVAPGHHETTGRASPPGSWDGEDWEFEAPIDVLAGHVYALSVQVCNATETSHFRDAHSEQTTMSGAGMYIRMNVDEEGKERVYYQFSPLDGFLAMQPACKSANCAPGDKTPGCQ